MPEAGQTKIVKSMLYAVALRVLMRLTRWLVFGIFTRVALVAGTRFMPGIHCGLLRNIAAQLFAQFSRVIGINLCIKAGA